MNKHSPFISPVLAVALIGTGLLFAQHLVQAAESQSNGAAMARGAKAWGENCARCHNMRDPKEFRDDLWRPIVAHMRVRAGLTGQQARDILLFLQQSN